MRTLSLALRVAAWASCVAAALVAAVWLQIIVSSGQAAWVFRWPPGLPPWRAVADSILVGGMGLLTAVGAAVLLGCVAQTAAGYWRSWVCPRLPWLAWPAVVTVTAVTGAILLPVGWAAS